MAEIKQVCIDGFCATTEEQKWTKDYPDRGDTSHSVVMNDVENNDASGNADGSPVGYATAEGYNTKALGAHSHTEGINCTVYSANGHAEGMGCVVGASATPAGAKGGHAEGNNCKALATAAHAEGSNNTASGLYAHAEGSGNTASGAVSHAEGESNTTSGKGSHAGGYNNRATGMYAFAHGENNNAGHERAVTVGLSLISNQKAQTVLGRSNVATDGVLVIGIGQDTSQSPARTNGLVCDWSGNVTATSFIQSSDEELKENIVPIGDSTKKSSNPVIDFFKELNPVSFDWKEDIPYNDGNRHFGFIAQEVQALEKKYDLESYGIVKEPTAEGEYMSMNYIELIPLLVKVVQDQQKEIDSLKALVKGDEK